jgi:hypothetical protein
MKEDTALWYFAAIEGAQADKTAMSISASNPGEKSWTAKSDCKAFIEVSTGNCRFDMISIHVLDRKDRVHHDGSVIATVVAVSHTNR